MNENDGSGLTWYRDGSQTGIWKDWCSSSGEGADSVCFGLNFGNNGGSINAFNTKSHCGYRDWHLPSSPNALNSSYASDMGGNWGSIGIYALDNGYSNGNALNAWFSTNRFTIENNNNYWSSAGIDNNSAFGVRLSNGSVQGNNSSSAYGVLVVRGSR